MKKIILAIMLAVAVYYEIMPGRNPLEKEAAAIANTGDSVLAKAFNEQQSNIQVQGSGTVLKILPDDNRGSRHQRFILQLDSQQTVLIAHNIDLAPKVNPLNPKDRVEFNGEYEWSPKGGVIHWTHHDPKRIHQGGWLKNKGKTYQ